MASGYRTKAGEVDIIAWDGDILVFVEVKARRSDDPPENAVGETKRRRIFHAARSYVARHRLNEKTHRFDILAISESSGQSPEFRLLRDVYRVYN